MLCRCIPQLGGKHMCVCLRGKKKNRFKAALFAHLKFYFIYLNTFSYFLNRRFFFFPQNCENYSLMHEKCMYPFSF